MDSPSPPYAKNAPQARAAPLPTRARPLLPPPLYAQAATWTTFFRVLLCLTIFFYLGSSSYSAHLLPWRVPVASRFGDSVGGLISRRKGYSILLNTWKRNDLLKQSVIHYASCAGLESIHIIWSEPHPPPDSLRDYLRQSLQSKYKSRQEVKIIFDLNEENSLNNRFKEVKDLSTDAVFSIDDDIILPCSTVEFAFTIWQSAPNVMVGFVPRMHWLDKYNGGMIHYRYGGWWSVWWWGTYSMILSKAAFFHKKYLYLYMHEMQESIRDYITSNRNCEDIAMSFLVANVSQAPPIWVKDLHCPASRMQMNQVLQLSGRIYELGWAGISTLVGHSERRTQCLNDFTLIYGHMPLMAAHTKAVDSRNTWFW